jgi:hypothetical protein
VLILTQDRCKVSAERTIGSEVVLGAPDGTLSDVRNDESCFGPFRDGFSVGAR